MAFGIVIPFTPFGASIVGGAAVELLPVAGGHADGLLRADAGHKEPVCQTLQLVAVMHEENGMHDPPGVLFAGCRLAAGAQVGASRYRMIRQSNRGPATASPRMARNVTVTFSRPEVSSAGIG